MGALADRSMQVRQRLSRPTGPIERQTEAAIRNGEVGVEVDRFFRFGNRGLEISLHHMDATQHKVREVVLVVQGHRLLSDQQCPAEALVGCVRPTEKQLIIEEERDARVSWAETGVQIDGTLKQLFRLGGVDWPLYSANRQPPHTHQVVYESNRQWFQTATSPDHGGSGGSLYASAAAPLAPDRTN